MSADIETIKKIADMAAIAIEEEELYSLARELDSIISYMKQISKVDTGKIKPMEHVLEICNVMREDVPGNENMKDELMQIAPKVSNGSYIVPNVVEL